MFKFNATAPMQPVQEESEQHSARRRGRTPGPSHELSGQDTAIIARIKRIRDILDSLRLKLSVERNSLERERWETASVCSLYQPTVIPINRDYLFHCVPGFSPYPPPYYYTECSDRWGSANSMQDERLIGSCSYGSPVNSVNNNHNVPRSPSTVRTSVSSNFKEQLDDVQKMCEEEFNKMQESISSLRRMKVQITDNNSEEDFPDVSEYVRVSRKEARSGHKQHKSHPRSHRGSRQSNSGAPDEREHRSQYYFNYKPVTPRKKRYFYSPQAIIAESREDYSGDTTETSNPVWHFNSSYDSDVEYY